MIEITIVCQESGGFGAGPWGRSDEAYLSEMMILIQALKQFSAKLPDITEKNMRIHEYSEQCAIMYVLTVCKFQVPYTMKSEYEISKRGLEMFLEGLFNIPVVTDDWKKWDHRLGEAYDGIFEFPEDILDQIDVSGLDDESFRYKFIEDQFEEAK